MFPFAGTYPTDQLVARRRAWQSRSLPLSWHLGVDEKVMFIVLFETDWSTKVKRRRQGHQEAAGTDKEKGENCEIHFSISQFRSDLITSLHLLHL